MRQSVFPPPAKMAAATTTPMRSTGAKSGPASAARDWEQATPPFPELSQGARLPKLEEGGGDGGAREEEDTFDLHLSPTQTPDLGGSGTVAPGGDSITMTTGGDGTAAFLEIGPRASVCLHAAGALAGYKLLDLWCVAELAPCVTHESCLRVRWLPPSVQVT